MEISRDKAYQKFLSELKSRIVSARITASRVVNRELILLYWDIGKRILEKQEALGWGKSVVESLARDLRKEFPGSKGFSADNVWRMRQFYVEYAGPEFLEQLVPELAALCKGRSGLIRNPAILEQPVPELTGTGRPSTPAARAIFLRLVAEVPWGHHVEILKKVKRARTRLFYMLASSRFGWSRSVLVTQIKAKAHNRARILAKSHNFPRALPVHLAEQADEALKSIYNLEFLGIAEPVLERHLESRLIEKLKSFILELGYGFCFVGNQYRLTLGANEYFIDLLFYHRFLKCLVAIELKAGRFKPEYAGKMDFYLNLLNSREKAPGDNPSVGIILCADKDDLEVEFSLKTKRNPIGVAEYRLYRDLPKPLRGKLPSARQISEGLGGV